MQTPIKLVAWQVPAFSAFWERSHAVSKDRPSITVPKKFHIEPEGITSLGRKKKLINNSGIPQHEIEHIARCILPDILAYYESEEGQREFRGWLNQREAGQTEGKEGKNA